MVWQLLHWPPTFANAGQENAAIMAVAASMIVNVIKDFFIYSTS
jgi:hypothetical protein